MFNKLEVVSLTVIDCAIDVCFKELSSFVNDDGVNQKYNIEERILCYDDIYSIIPPKGGAHFSKFLIWEPKNLLGKTAFFSNYRDGKYTLIYNFCKKYKLEAVSVNFSNKKNTEFPAFMFKYFNYSKHKSIERTIYLIKDGNKWVFFENGKEQAFENTSNYKNKLKTKRFNKEILLDYLLKMNINIESEEFWQSTNDNSFYFDQISW